MINKIINGFSKELISEVCPSTAKYVRPIVKLPMIAIMTCCGICVGLNLVAFTFIGELLQSGTFLDAPGMIAFLITIGLTFSIGLLFITNFCISLYDQLDAMPVFYSMNMIFNIVCGLVLLGEASRYPTSKIIGICIGLIIAVIGILVLGYKKTYIDTEEEKKKERTEDEGTEMIERLDTTNESLDEASADTHKLKLIKILTETQQAPSAPIERP